MFFVVILAAIHFPQSSAVDQATTHEISIQQGPPYKVTVWKFIGGFVKDLTFGYKTMSFEAINVYLISRTPFHGFTTERYTNNEKILVKQTTFKGIMTDFFLWGISIYTYSIHF
jgi:hypothetical protein